MIIGSADINLTKNSLSASEAQNTADDALEKAKEAIKLNASTWYLQSVALTSANGQNTNFYGALTPEDPKENDLWFVYNEDGNVTNMLRYKNGEWVAEVDLSNAKEMLKQAEEIAKRMESNTAKFDSLFANVTNLWVDSDEQNGKIANVKASVDGLQTTVTNLSNNTSAQFTQLSDQINLKVSKGSVISQINLEAESATIVSKAIVLAGDTTVTGSFTVPAAQITGKLSANQIAVSQLSALTADLGNVTAGKISGVEITGSKINVTTDLNVGNYIYLGDQYNLSNDKGIRFNYWSHIYIDSDDSSRIKIGSSNVTVGNSNNAYVDVNGQTQQIDIYTYNGQINLTASNTYLHGDIYATDGYVQINRLDLGTSLHYEAGYLTAPAGSLSISQNTVKANTITQLSNADYKKNIVDWEYNALEMINGTPIKQYQYKSELNEEFPHVGIIVQEAPVWAVSIDGDGIEPYSMATLSWKAIQELSAENESLKKRIEALENKAA